MLLSNLDVLATAPGGVDRLRELILTLAVQGKLVPQDPADEPASELLKKIRVEKDRLIAAGKIRQDKLLAEIAENEKPYELPAGWEWVRFGDASINRDGERKPVSSADRDNRAKIYDYYGASGVIDKIDGFLFDKTLLLIGEDGANLLSRSTPIAFLAHGKYWVNNHAHVIDATHRELLDYLALFINAISLEPYVTGTAQPKMNQSKLNSILVACPPLAEQSRIVTRVEELMRLCDALEAKGQLEAAQHAQLVSTLLGQLTASSTPDELHDNWQRVAQHFDLLLDRPAAVDALEQTILQLAVRGLLVAQDPTDEPASTLLQKIRLEKDRLIAEGKIKRDKPLPLIAEDEKPFGLPVGWEWAQAYETCDPSSLITYGILKPVWVGSGVPTVRVQDMKGGGIVTTALGQCSFERAERFEKTKLAAGDLLIAKDGATLGKTAVVPPELAGGNITQHVLRFPISVALDRKYVRLVIDSEHGQTWMLSETKGVALPGVNVGDFRRMPIPLPPLAEQSRIVTRVASLRRLCADLRQRLAARQSTQAQLAEALVNEVA